MENMASIVCLKESVCVHEQHLYFIVLPKLMPVNFSLSRTSTKATVASALIFYGCQNGDCM